MAYTTSEIMSMGMECLVEKLGPVGAERFISTVIRESSDYTKWRREIFDNMTADEILNGAIEHEIKHPFNKMLRSLIIGYCQ